MSTSGNMIIVVPETLFYNKNPGGMFLFLLCGKIAWELRLRRGDDLVAPGRQHHMPNEVVCYDKRAASHAGSHLVCIHVTYRSRDCSGAVGMDQLGTEWALASR